VNWKRPAYYFLFRTKDRKIASGLTVHASKKNPVLARANANKWSFSPKKNQRTNSGQTGTPYSQRLVNQLQHSATPLQSVKASNCGKCPPILLSSDHTEDPQAPQSPKNITSQSQRGHLSRQPRIYTHTTIVVCTDISVIFYSWLAKSRHSLHTLTLWSSPHTYIHTCIQIYAFKTYFCVQFFCALTYKQRGQRAQCRTTTQLWHK